MKKTHIGIALCLLLALSATQPSPKAQDVTKPSGGHDVATGEDMDEVAEAVVKGLIQRDMTPVWDNLAPWHRNRFTLFADKLRESEAMTTLTDEETRELTALLDPKGHIGIKSADDLRELKDAQLFGLLGGAYVRDWWFEDDELKAEDVLQTQRFVGLVETDAEGHKLQQWTAIVRYLPGQFYLELVPTPDGWVVTEMDCGWYVSDSASLSISELLGAPLQLAHVTSWSGLREIRKAEGEQLLRSARDYCRVEYSKTASAGDVVEPFEELVEGGAFDGQHYRLTDYHYGFSESEYDAAVSVEPVLRFRPRPGTVDPLGLLLFKWVSGESTIEWFDTRADLRARLDELRGD